MVTCFPFSTNINRTDDWSQMILIIFRSKIKHIYTLKPSACSHIVSIRGVIKFGQHWIAGGLCAKRIWADIAANNQQLLSWVVVGVCVCVCLSRRLVSRKILRKHTHINTYKWSSEELGVCIFDSIALAAVGLCVFMKFAKWLGWLCAALRFIYCTTFWRNTQMQCSVRARRRLFPGWSLIERIDKERTIGDTFLWTQTA